METPTANTTASARFCKVFVLLMLFLGVFEGEKLQGQTIFGPQQIIQITEIDYPISVYATDMDGDGDMDVLSASRDDDKITWHENDGSGNFGAQQIISTAADGVRAVYAADLDGDGDMDVLSASWSDHKIAWYENDGNGNFGTQQIISTTTSYATSVYAVDLDNDGDVDVLSASFWDDKIAWHENEGSGNLGLQQIISTAADGPTSVYAADLDNDGDMDVLSASFSDEKIAWYENDGSGNFGTQQILSTAEVYAGFVYAADLDGDGDMDVLFSASGNDKIAWHENDGSGGFGTQQIISTIPDTKAIYAADMDGDGDMDVLSASGDEDNIAWFENDGSGNFGTLQIISTVVDYATSVYAADLDGDGDMDVLSASSEDDKIAWYENLSSNPKISGYVFYDANQNGAYDTGEYGLDYIGASIETIGGEIVLSYANVNGFYTNVLNESTGGDYTLNFNPPDKWIMTTSDIYNLSLAAGESSVNNNFGIYPDTLYTEVQPFLTSQPTRCGFQVPFTLTYVNEGTTIPALSVVRVVLDPLTQFVSSPIPPDSIDLVNNVVYWHFNYLPPGQQNQISFNVQMPGVDAMNEVLSFNASIRSYDANGDLLHLGTFGYRPTLTCAYDPNDKLANPEGVGDENYTLMDEDLVYTIRFQNTGTDTAFNIIITDTLSQHLDWTSFRPITSSHPMQAYLHEDGMAEFQFNNILLPDSNVNEPASHGFVMYRISPVGSLPEETVVENSANIYFDFNPPIITNTTQNTYVSVIPSANLDPVCQAKVLLQGAYDPATGAMKTELLDNGLLPLFNPFKDNPWNYGGSEQMASYGDFPPNTVDWVLVEARSSSNPDVVLADKAALLLSNGSIIGVDGSAGVNFGGLPVNVPYRIVVRQRNHLDLMSSTAISIPNATPANFTVPSGVMGGVSQLADLGNGKFGMLAGDFNGDGLISVADYNLFKLDMSCMNEYLQSDCDLNGSATVNDYNWYIQNASAIGVDEVRY